MAETPHLSTLFKTGQPLTVETGEGTEIHLWLRKPSSLQQQEAMKHARASRARILTRYLDEGSDEYQVISVETDRTDREGLIEILLMKTTTDHRRQSNADVLYGTYGSDWGDDGQKYIDAVGASAQRYVEILDFNQQLSEEDSSLVIDLASDDELKKLEVIEQTFAGEVEARLEELQLNERENIELDKTDVMREKVLEYKINTESELAWFEQYTLRMIHFSVRYPNEHDLIYFEKHTDVMELPVEVRSQIFAAYEQLDGGADEVKKLQSLQSSLD